MNIIETTEHVNIVNFGEILKCNILVIHSQTFVELTCSDYSVAQPTSFEVSLIFH